MDKKVVGKWLINCSPLMTTEPADDGQPGVGAFDEPSYAQREHLLDVVLALARWCLNKKFIGNR